MQDRKEMLASAPIGRLLFKLALPTVVAQLINMLYNVVDRIFIGHIKDIGDLALTGIGVCVPLIMLVSAFAALVSSGGAPRASIFMGKGDTESAEQTLGACFALQIAVSAVITAVLLIFNKPILLAFGASENTIEYALSYMNVYAVGTVFVQITLGMNAFITAQGFTRVSMTSVLIGAVANIALDPLFIYAFDMGATGAALATVIAQAISCIYALSFICGKKAVLRLQIRHIRIAPKVVLPCIALGSATFIMQASESVITVSFNSSLLHYGSDIAVGAMTILYSVMQFALLPVQGIAQGAQPIMSYNYGAKRADRVKRTFILLCSICLGYTLAMWGSVMLFPAAFAGIFTDKPDLILFTASVMPIYFGGIFLFGIQMACQMTFVSLGNAVSSVMVAVVRKFLLLLPLIYVLPAIMSDPLKAVYTAEPIADILAVLFTCILFFFRFRRAMQGIEKNEFS